MKSSTTSTPDMRTRVARFKDLATIAAQAEADVPVSVMDLIFVRQIKPVVALNSAGEGAIGAAPIAGASGITISYGICPPGTGPTLHAHMHTYETFTVFRSKFRFSWGESGEHSVDLDPLDVISVPPGVNRAFINIGAEEGIVHVVISGEDHDDAYFPAHTTEKIRALDEKYLEYFKKHRLKFR